MKPQTFKYEENSGGIDFVVYQFRRKGDKKYGFFLPFTADKVNGPKGGRIRNAVAATIVSNRRGIRCGRMPSVCDIAYPIR